MRIRICRWSLPIHETSTKKSLHILLTKAKKDHVVAHKTKQKQKISKMHFINIPQRPNHSYITNKNKTTQAVAWTLGFTYIFVSQTKEQTQLSCMSDLSERV